MQTSKLCMPVGIIWSTQDPVVNEAQTKLLLQCIPQALVQKIDHCGHAPYVEDPDQYFRALVNWLAC
jgi:pimeloyl-ACP methyl ester carboxylesterase